VRTPREPSGVLGDTMFACRLRPTRLDLLAAALSARGTVHEPLLGASVVSEVVDGLRRGAVADQKYAALAIWWESHILAGPHPLRVVVPSVEALVERRLSWCQDRELAALGATPGLPVASANLADFGPIGELLVHVAPA
jgi:hypothetical protein